MVNNYSGEVLLYWTSAKNIKIQDNSLIPDNVLNIFIYGSHFFVITNTSCKLFKMVQFF